MFLVCINVSKDKHDCFILSSDDEVLFAFFTIFNNIYGFQKLYQKIMSVETDLSKIKVGLEAKGHYSYNLLGFLLDKHLPSYVINPLLSNLCGHSAPLNHIKSQ